MTKHTHAFKEGKSGKIAICACGKWKHVNFKQEDIIEEIPAKLKKHEKGKYCAGPGCDCGYGAKHTPGPWRLILEDKHFEVIDSENEQLAHTVSLSNDDGGYIEEANARLIAAAPELLEAAKNLCADLLRRGVEHGKDKASCNAWDAMQDALAKAEGGHHA